MSILGRPQPMATHQGLKATQSHWAQVLGDRRLRSRGPGAVLPPQAPREGPFCLFQLLGAPSGPELVVTSLLSLPPSLCGFSSVSGSPLLSRRRTLSLEGGAPHPGGPPLRPFPWLLLCVWVSSPASNSIQFSIARQGCIFPINPQETCPGLWDPRLLLISHKDNGPGLRSRWQAAAALPWPPTPFQAVASITSSFLTSRYSLPLRRSSYRFGHQRMQRLGAVMRVAALCENSEETSLFPSVPRWLLPFDYLHQKHFHRPSFTLRVPGAEYSDYIGAFCPWIRNWMLFYHTQCLPEREIEWKGAESKSEAEVLFLITET